MHDALEFMTREQVGKEMYRAHTFFVTNAQRDIADWESPEWDALTDEEKACWEKAGGKFISNFMTSLDIATTAILVGFERG